MQLTIDSLTGAGPVDYTGSIDAANSVVIKRVLNAPSECRFTFLQDAQGLPLPQRYARLSVADDAGLVLFTGYVVQVPAMVLLGQGTAGPCYGAQITAVSDEVLLDNLLSVRTGTALNQPAAAALQQLAQLAGGAPLTLTAPGATSLIGRYEAKAATRWSAAAGNLAASVRSAVRMIGGVTSFSPVGSIVHTLSEADGSLQLQELRASTVRLLANDVTVCGRIEPAAYVTETFIGDGTTKDFFFTGAPFTPGAGEKLAFSDQFTGAALNGQVWAWTDGGARLSLSAAGVNCSGGTGREAETVLSAIHQIELGGSTVLEAGGVQIGGQGLLLGLYAGSVTSANCFAAFQVSQANGVTHLSALINGVVGGSSFSIQVGHTYTLRMRVYSPEMERVQQAYYYLDTNGINSYGGGVVTSPGHLVLEVQDVTSGLPGLPTVLYDGMTSTLPPACTIGLLDSGSLTCSIKTFNCEQTGPTWVMVTPAGGTAQSQYLGTTASGGSCSLASGGKLSFYAETIPASGSTIQVRYRTNHRAVARRNLVGSSGQTGVTPAAPSTRMWVGTVTEPAAWSSQDCDNAAAALLKSSAVGSAAWAGSYTGWNIEKAGDVWPGDVLAIASASAGMNVAVVVREVVLEMGTCVPQMIRYAIRFANDWAEDLALKLSNAVPEDAWLPAVPVSGGSTLPNLVALQVSSVTGAQIQVNAGASAPAGGGFEVKRKDWTFGPGVDSDLVLRSPVSNFTIPRFAAVEQYYVRMYDGATPPNYSQFSAGIFVDVPLGSN